MLARVEDISHASGISMPAYGHAGDGNLHVNFLWNDSAERPRVDEALLDLLRATLAMGGTLSGEHGIGVMKAPFLSLEQDEALISLQKNMKSVFDPHGLLNPGKIFAASGHRAC